MEFIDSKLDEYIQKHTSLESDLLQELNRETYLKVLQPRMLSGPYQGRLLSMLSKMIHPKRILEIGTYTGYSALCLAEGLSEEGKLITLDINPELEDFVRSFFNRSEYARKIDFRIGNALEVIPGLNEEFDLVFIDADKENYLNYYHLVLDKIKSGGYIFTDNVLWSGKVLQELSLKDTETRAIVEYNNYLMNDSRVENILLPVRDGIMLTRKK